MEIKSEDNKKDIDESKSYFMIEVDDNDGVFMWDIDKTYPNSNIIYYKSTIFNGKFKDFKQMDYGSDCKNVRLRISRDGITKLFLSLKLKDNKFSFLDTKKDKKVELNFKQL